MNDDHYTCRYSALAYIVKPLVVSRGGRWGRSPPLGLTHKERKNKVDENSRKEEQIKPNFLFQIVKIRA